MAVMESAFVPARRVYPWDKWSNGKWWKATAGEDFDCSPLSFKGAIYNHALRHKKSAQTEHVEGESVVRFCLTKKPAKKKAVRRG